MNSLFLILVIFLTFLGNVQLKEVSIKPPLSYMKPYRQMNECLVKGNFATNYRQFIPKNEEATNNFCKFALPRGIECIKKTTKKIRLNAAQKTFLGNYIQHLKIRNTKYCTAYEKKQLQKERLYYQNKTNLLPLILCNNIFKNLTILLVDYINRETSFELNQTIAEVFCLNAQLAQTCLKERLNETRNFIETFTETTMNLQVNPKFIDSYLQLLFNDSSKTCPKNLVMFSVLNKLSPDFQYSFAKSYFGGLSLFKLSHRKFYFAYPYQLQLLTLAINKDSSNKSNQPETSVERLITFDNWIKIGLKSVMNAFQVN